MSRVVWKFEFNIDTARDIPVQMPMVSNIVASRFHPVTRLITFWAVCKETSELVTKQFMVRGTGQSYDREDNQVVAYAFTVFDDEHQEVWHVFELMGERQECPGRA